MEIGISQQISVKVFDIAFQQSLGNSLWHAEKSEFICSLNVKESL